MENSDNLIKSTLEQKPLDFEKAFDDLIISKLQAAINNKKIEVAKQIYGYEEPESEE